MISKLYGIKFNGFSFILIANLLKRIPYEVLGAGLSKGFQSVFSFNWKLLLDRSKRSEPLKWMTVIEFIRDYNLTIDRVFVVLIFETVEKQARYKRSVILCERETQLLFWLQWNSPIIDYLCFVSISSTVNTTCSI